MGPSASPSRCYKRALEILNSRRRLKRPSNGPIVAASDGENLPGGQSIDALKGVPSIAGMRQWFLQIGHTMKDLDNLNIIHVAGTKGKGSTCAFIECFLRSHGTRTGFPTKTGLYTSPHLIYPEERIRLNFQPISRSLFAKYFFEVWDALNQDSRETKQMPRYLQLLALVAFHTFISEGVEAAILETHHGGEYDATNFIDSPIATVVTSLGMDHVEQLGPTIKHIAWHKAGIFKRGASAFSTVQSAEAAQVLQERASEKGLDLIFVDTAPSLPVTMTHLRPSVQQRNCSVAMAASDAFLQKTSRTGEIMLSQADKATGLAQFSWPGRFQTIDDGSCTWLLDGAHNEMSVREAADWFVQFSDAASENKLTTRILIFGQVSEQRDAVAVLRTLAQAVKAIAIDYVVFAAFNPHDNFNVSQGFAPMSAPSLMANFVEEWSRVSPKSQILCKPNIQAAVETAKDINQRMGVTYVFVTGSQHLVGGVIQSIQQSTDSSL